MAALTRSNCKAYAFYRSIHPSVVPSFVFYVRFIHSFIQSVNLQTSALLSALDSVATLGAV